MLTWMKLSRSSLCFIFVEGLLVAASLALFAFEYPDTARISLWEEGGAKGFNSDPKLRIYFYANYQEPPEIPFIWSQAFTDLNLGAAIITFWIFTTRTILVCMVIVNKWTTVFLQSCALLFWLFSIAAQQSSDYSDNDHPSRTPWYLTHSCAIAQPETQAACRVAQASFGTTIVLILFYSASIWKIFAYEWFKYMLKQFQINYKTEKSYWPDLVEDGEFSDESPLTMAWDEV